MVEFNFRHLSFIRSSSGSLIASNILFSSREILFLESVVKNVQFGFFDTSRGAGFKSIVCLFVFLFRNFQVGFDKYLVCIYILANPSASQWLVHQTQVSKHRATSICSNCISSHPFPLSSFTSKVSHRGLYQFQMSNRDPW